MHHGRVTFLATFVVLGFLSVTIRLVDLMVFERGRLTEKASQQHMKLETVDAKRGTIYDARMRELVVDKTVDSVYADPRKIGDPERTLQFSWWTTLNPKTGERGHLTTPISGTGM